MRCQIRAQCFRLNGDLSELKRAGMRCAFRDSLTELLLRGLSKTRQFRHAPVVTRFSQLLDRTDAELIVKSLDLFRAEPRQPKQFKNPRWKLRAKFFEIFERSACREFLDL